ncbi:mechanosensitive ion channel family protein [Oscillatoriales cyanobacterium LEGE 11467]|uniref:Mechanosensitive ion channel family protein n=1 Tax=Zarconia navalis LEGE 11467 TaxID=1828826 RepID=A0A928VZY3_9CYAN|nr:mechanosensitive ion channel family protein [Zarconia navalis LEGE 11467]
MLPRLTGIAIVVCTTWVIVPPSIAQDAEVPPPTAQTSQPVAAPSDGLYFADIVVRGRPIFQVGSLSGISATDRAEIINRRIASILAKADTLETVTVQTDGNRKLATLQLNNRVLMTVTDRDAEDFGLSVDALAQKWADALNRAIDKPPLAIDVVQRLYGTTRQLLRDTVENLPALIGAILVVLATGLVAQGVRRIAFAWAQRTEGDRSTEILIGRLGYGGVWILGCVVALGVLGLDIGALLGALGLTSVAIGFSLKDVLSNYISGVILLAARPFRIGDQLVIEDYEGTVTQIQLRGTTMKTYDGRVVYIPNQEVFQSSIINNTASTHRRSSVMVGIDYDADINEAIRVIKGSLDRLDEVEFDPPLEVLVRELAASTVNLEVRFWVDSRRAGFLQATSKVTQAVKEALEEAQIEMPTDIYTLAIRNMPTIPVKTVGDNSVSGPM